MVKIFRDKENEQYWDDRWESCGVDIVGGGGDIYPLKYAVENVFSGAKILEIGVGAGRVYLYFLKNGFEVCGIERSEIAVKNILKHTKDANVFCENVCDMHFANESFDRVFAFGVYHNIEDLDELQRAFYESKRVLKKGGQLVFSVRYHSLENRLIEKIIRRQKKGEFKCFHRWHFEFSDILRFLGNDMVVQKVSYVRNVSFLFKFKCFRKRTNFNEAVARNEGFLLNPLGSFMDRILHKIFSKAFSNLMVIVAQKG